MNSKSILNQAGAFVAYFLFQIFVADRMILFNSAFCLVYVGFILSIPYTIGPINLLLVSFLMGILIDTFHNTQGIHAAACVLIAFLRPHWINVLAARSNMDTDNIIEISIRQFSFSWFVIYLLVLIFIHHLTVFLIEASSRSLLLFSLKNATFSTIFTFVVIILIQYLFFSSRSRR